MRVLHSFLSEHREEIVARARAKVAARAAPRASEEQLRNGPPLFLDQLIASLRLAKPSVEASDAIDASATAHGAELLKMGFTVGQVVHDYGSVCQAVTELAEEVRASITNEEFRTLNQCLDEAIAGAVTEYTLQRERSITAEGTERLGALAHGMRNRLSAAMLAFEMLKTGTVGVSGSTAAILGRNLRGLRDLIDLSLADVRLQAQLQKPTRVALFELVEEIEIEATMDANVRNVQLSVTPVAPGLTVDADRSLLAAAVANLVQNALKFTRKGGHVALRVITSGGRVLIEIEDECGGLPPGGAEEMFEPYVQRSPDRTGLGLGLSISRKSVEANGGLIRVRDLPGKGCVFTIDLPIRASTPAA